MTTARFDNVSVRFGQRWALVRLNAQFESGTVTLITGDNGAGKTTALRVLSTVLKPHVGTLELFGRPAQDDLAAARAQIGVVSHASHLYEDLTGRENLSFFVRLGGISATSQEMSTWLDRVGLSEAADRPVRTYSAGMRRRLGVARVQAKKPKLALLDEPFGQLDPAGVELMKSVIADLKTSGATVVFSTHNIALGVALADQHLVMRDGRLVDAVTNDSTAMTADNGAPSS